MNILKRIDELKDKRGWTLFELTNRSNLSEYTVYSWFRRGSKPTVYALECICDAFGITMSEFFREIGEDGLTSDQVALLQSFEKLTDSQRRIVLSVVKSYEDLNVRLGAAD